jgi:hypothetical protein
MHYILSIFTLDQVPQEDLMVRLDEVALAAHRDSSEHVVTRGHDRSDVRTVKCVDHADSHWLQLVLHH